jgi:hypothetical protein
VEPQEVLDAPLTRRPVRAAVAACGIARAGAAELPALRKDPGAPADRPLPPSFLKHSDEQSVVALAAVYQALRAAALEPASLGDWGVIAAPQFLGWTAFPAALLRFREEGAWGISPHLIPHRSLHALSGTVSQALGLHGPNFGVGGGPRAADEGLLTAAALLGQGRVPGLWALLTGFAPDTPGVAPVPAQTTWQAVALALVAYTPDVTGPWLHVGPPTHAPDEPANGLPLFELDAFATAVAAGRAGAWRLAGGSCLELHPAADKGDPRP